MSSFESMQRSCVARKERMLSWLEKLTVDCWGWILFFLLQSSCVKQYKSLAFFFFLKKNISLPMYVCLYFMWFSLQKCWVSSAVAEGSGDCGFFLVQSVLWDAGWSEKMIPATPWVSSISGDFGTTVSRYSNFLSVTEEINLPLLKRFWK